MHTICPVCRCDCGTYYIDRSSGEILGCERCIEERDAGEYEAEREVDQADFYRELCGFGVDR